MIKRSHVRYFLAVVEAGSFTRAAARVNVTQPTLSLGIAQLERLTQTQLLIRDRRFIRLTDAGARFLPLAKEMERAFREADAFGNSIRESAPELLLGIIPTLAPPMFQCAVAALAKDFTLKVVEGNDIELRTLLADGRIHAALGSTEPFADAAQSVPILKEKFALMVAASHRLAGTATIKPEDLAAELMVARRECEALEATSRFFTRHQVRPRFVLRSADEQRCMAVVRAGVAVTTAPLSFAGDDVVAVAVEGYEIERTLGLSFTLKALADDYADSLQRAGAQIAAQVADPTSGIMPAAYRVDTPDRDGCVELDLPSRIAA